MQFLLSKKLLHVGKLYNKLIARELPQIQSDYDVAILSVLFSNKNKINQQEIAAILNVDKSHVAILINSLVQRNYIYTERNALDRRERHIFLTDRGKMLIPAIQKAIERVNGLINKKLNEASLSSFYSVLMQMESNLSDKVNHSFISQN